MIRKAIFLGGRYSGKREELDPVRNVERDGDTYTSVSDPYSTDTVIYVQSGCLTKVEQLLVSEINRLDQADEENRAYIRVLLKKTETFKAVG